MARFSGRGGALLQPFATLSSGVIGCGQGRRGLPAGQSSSTPEFPAIQQRRGAELPPRPVRGAGRARPRRRTSCLGKPGLHPDLHRRLGFGVAPRESSACKGTARRLDGAAVGGRYGVERGWLAGKEFSKAGGQREAPDALDRNGVAVSGIELAAALGFAEAEPVGRAVDCYVENGSRSPPI